MIVVSAINSFATRWLLRHSIPNHLICWNIQMTNITLTKSMHSCKSRKRWYARYNKGCRWCIPYKPLEDIKEPLLVLWVYRWCIPGWPTHHQSMFIQRWGWDQESFVLMGRSWQNCHILLSYVRKHPAKRRKLMYEFGGLNPALIQQHHLKEQPTPS